MSADRRAIAAAILVAAAAFALVACGGDDDAASAEFTGDGCTYSGPTEFEVGDEFAITVTDTSEERADVGYAVSKVEDGTSVDQIREQGIEPFADDDHGTFLFSRVTEPGTEREMSTVLHAEGTWVVHCFVMGGTSSEDAGFPAATFEVVARS